MTRSWVDSNFKFPSLGCNASDGGFMELYFFTKCLSNILKSAQASADLNLSPDPKKLFYGLVPIIQAKCSVVVVAIA